MATYFFRLTTTLFLDTTPQQAITRDVKQNNKLTFSTEQNYNTGTHTITTYNDDAEVVTIIVLVPTGKQMSSRICAVSCGRWCVALCSANHTWYMKMHRSDDLVLNLIFVILYYYR